MPDNEIDLLAIDRGTVTAPAGCGKTQLIADALTRHSGSKPILVLTHTNAGVAALRERLVCSGQISTVESDTPLRGPDRCVQFGNGWGVRARL